MNQEEIMQIATRIAELIERDLADTEEFAMLATEENLALIASSIEPIGDI